MSDDIYKPDADDEYQFTDNEQAVVYKSKPNKPLAGIFANRRMWLTIAFIIIAVVLYKLYGLYKANTSVPAIKVVPTPVMEQAVVQPKPLPAPIATEPAPMQRQMGIDWAEAKQESAKRFSDVEQSLASVSRDNQAVRNQLSQVQNDMRALLNQMASLQQQLVKLSDTKKPIQPVTKAIAKKPVAVRPHYFVQAALPGRAWLVKAEDNSTLTVAVGDELPGYGKVITINPIQASVMTSSNYTISYRPN
jgi:intracellular multiplication protein IcmG